MIPPTSCTCVLVDEDYNPDRILGLTATVPNYGRLASTDMYPWDAILESHRINTLEVSIDSVIAERGDVS
jgi:hypothetical protein